MLPYLMPKKASTTVMVHKAEDKGESSSELEAIAEDLLRAVAAKDSKAVAAALEAAFYACDSEPHVEGEHL